MGSSDSSTPHTLPLPDSALPSRWSRVAPKGLPEGVTMLSLPGVGTGWYGRGVSYWIARLIIFALYAGTVVFQVLIYKLILWDDPNTTRFGAMWWGVLIFGTVATAEGLRVTRPGNRLLWKVLQTDPGRLIRTVLTVPFLTYAFSVAFLAPGIYLGGTIKYLQPITWEERIARADLDAQLRAHPHHHPGGRR